MVGPTAAVSRTKTFQGAVCVLNSLQSKAAAPEPLDGRRQAPGRQLQAMGGLLHHVGIAVGELDRLNIIHVTGTKGKGSTCAFTESILRSCGLRTGFYSSPHLVHVRERIRVDGRPISEQLFAKYFWETYERLEDAQSVHGGTMPFYFQFLTLLAFHVFLQERVDLAVIEVGIGGQHDCTNVIRKPWVCGITSLGLDHCSLLGDTMEKIAWQKAGIFKPGVPAFTVRQPPGPLGVVRRRAEEIGCPLWICPELDQHEAVVGPVSLGLAGKHQRSNAALALQLSHSWLQRRKAEQRGLQEAEWLGRSQTLRRGSVTFYLDGAHTEASMQACVSWFRQEELQRGQSRSPALRVLLFNTTGERDSAALLRLLVPCQFDYALFCPHITETPVNKAAHRSTGVCVQRLLSRCRDNQSLWQSLTASSPQGPGLLFPCILSALRWIGRGEQPALEPAGSPGRVSVLVTGSLYLVGGVLKHLRPSTDS